MAENVVFQQPGAVPQQEGLNQPGQAAGFPEPGQFGQAAGRAGQPVSQYAGTPLEALDRMHQMFVQQKRMTCFELLSGCEARNVYYISDPTSTVMYLVRSSLKDS